MLFVDDFVGPTPSDRMYFFHVVHTSLIFPQHLHVQPEALINVTNLVDLGNQTGTSTTFVVALPLGQRFSFAYNTIAQPFLVYVSNVMQVGTGSTDCLGLNPSSVSHAPSSVSHAPSSVSNAPSSSSSSNSFSTSSVLASPASESAGSASNTPSSKSQFPVGAIVGIVLAVLAVILIALAAFWIMHRRSMRQILNIQASIPPPPDVGGMSGPIASYPVAGTIPAPYNAREALNLQAGLPPPPDAGGMSGPITRITPYPVAGTIPSPSSVREKSSSRPTDYAASSSGPSTYGESDFSPAPSSTLPAGARSPVNPAFSPGPSPIIHTDGGVRIQPDELPPMYYDYGAGVRTSVPPSRG
ncbi:hypothetical protein C8J57DRAFT_1525222 [Mycena rebaudengoi]|nr:hypothetical protein C8J57DRAFT_1525222 [Mycena rebaudengoi]